MCIRIYIFKFKKRNKNNMKIKSKETKEENRIPIENLMGYDDIISEFALYIFNLFDRVVNLSWLFRSV